MTDYYSNYNYVSQSMLKVFAESPELYFRRFVLKPDDPRHIAEKPATDAMILGRIVHSLFLEQGPLDKEFHIVDLPNRQSNAWKAEAANAKEWGKTPVLASVVKTACIMTDSARSNPHVQAFFDELPDECSELREQEIYWQGEFLPKKAKIDHVIAHNVDGNKKIVHVVELKTTNDPTIDAFTRQYFNMNNDVQAAWYEEGLKAHVKDDSCSFQHVVIAVRNTVPYDAALYHVDTEFLKIARNFLDRQERVLAKCYQSQDWTLNGVQGHSLLTPEKWMENK